jgi:hypothetical protein
VQVFTIAGTSAVSIPQVPDVQTGNFPLNGVLNTPSVDLPAARNVVAATTEGVSPVSIENNFNSIFEGQQSRRPETSVSGFVHSAQADSYPRDGISKTVNTPSVDSLASGNAVARATENFTSASRGSDFNSIVEEHEGRCLETSVTRFVTSVPSLAVVEPKQASQMMVGRVAPSQMQAHIGGMMPNFHLATPMVAYSSSYSNPMTAPPRKALQTARQIEEALRRPKEAYESYVPKQSPMPEYATLVKRRDAGEAAKGIVWQEKRIEG